VRFIYDWVGSLGYASPAFFRRLREAGVEVRCFNPPGLEFPFTWFTRDHRKLITVDGRIAYVTGLCVGDQWIGDPQNNRDPWRDNGVEIEGPALGEIERAFAASWATRGSPLPNDEVPGCDSIPRAGNVAVRVVAGMPNIAGLYRVDQLITTLARESIWIEDAYFVPTSSYVEALRAASKAGVDVRLLIPGVNDIPIMRALSRAGLRPLLEAGVRIYEWNGSMMHAKTAVVDGQWARVGSTNLNIASWLSNWEIDIIVEDADFSEEIRRMFLQDIQNSTEVVLKKNRPRAVKSRAHRPRAPQTGSATKAAAGVVRLGRAVSAAIADRELGPAEAFLMFWTAVLLMLLSLLTVLWPKMLAYPAAVFGVWISTLLLIRAHKLRKKRDSRNRLPNP
jgi:cardiolipin synthase